MQLSIAISVSIDVTKKLGLPVRPSLCNKQVRSRNEQKVSKRFPFDRTSVQSQPLRIIITVKWAPM